MTELMLAVAVLGVLLATICGTTAVILWLAVAPAPIKPRDTEGIDQ